MALGKGPNRCSSLGAWSTHVFLRRIRFSWKYAHWLSSVQRSKLKVRQRLPDFGNFNRPNMSENRGIAAKCYVVMSKARINVASMMHDICVQAGDRNAYSTGKRLGPQALGLGADAYLYIIDKYVVDRKNGGQDIG